jgi:histidine triad (HIT) family protein
MASLFTKIIRGEIPCSKIYEDDKCIAILDIFPNHKGHSLVIPKEQYETIMDCPQEILSHLMNIVKKISEKQMNVLSCHGINININNKKAAGQEIPHLHIHVIPRYQHDGYKLGFGQEKYQEGEIQEYCNILKI